MANNFLATANRVAAHLGKAPKDFTKEDIIRVVQDFDIRMVNLMYPGGDGRLKTLNFMLNSADYLNTILTCGERVDGSSLFSSIEAASSDLYVLPVFRTAFIDPFQEIPTLCLLCDYFDRDGDLAKGRAVVCNAKTRRVSVCNALDCLVIHRGRLTDLSELCAPLAGAHVTVYADEEALKDLVIEVFYEPAD